MDYNNYKKELAKALEEIKSSDWFKELNKENQEEVIRQQKAYYTPPTVISNCILNMLIEQKGLWNDFVKDLKKVIPYGRAKESGNIGLFKQKWAERYFPIQHRKDGNLYRN